MKLGWFFLKEGLQKKIYKQSIGLVSIGMLVIATLFIVHSLKAILQK